jgi:hypothetical protein
MTKSIQQYLMGREDNPDVVQDIVPSALVSPEFRGVFASKKNTSVTGNI